MANTRFITHVATEVVALLGLILFILKKNNGLQNNINVLQKRLGISEDAILAQEKVIEKMTEEHSKNMASLREEFSMLVSMVKQSQMGNRRPPNPRPRMNMPRQNPVFRNNKRPLAMMGEISPQALAVKPQPVAVKPQPVAVKSQPVAVKSQPVAVKSQPVAVKPQPVAVKPQQEEKSGAPSQNKFLDDNKKVELITASDLLEESKSAEKATTTDLDKELEDELAELEEAE
jgi:hypothetical protein